jgi:YVTN family beta-propeller protein
MCVTSYQRIDMRDCGKAASRRVGAAWIVSLLCVTACREQSRTTTRVFVSNEHDGTISVIDAARREVVATIGVGKRPRGMRLSRDGAWLYVALSGSPIAGPGVDHSTLMPPDRSADGIGVVDLQALTLARVIASGSDPESFDLAGENLLVVSNEDAAQVSIVDLATGRVRGSVDVGGEPEGVTTSHDGLVWVTAEADAAVYVIDPLVPRVVRRVATGLRPRAVAFTRDGSRGLISNENDGSLTVVDVPTLSVLHPLVLPREGSTPSGPRPMGIAMAPRGSHAYVTTGRGGSLAVLDVERAQVERVISDVGTRPWGVAVAPDGLIYTANGPSNDISIIDPGTNRIVERVPAGGSPWGIVISP